MSQTDVGWLGLNLIDRSCAFRNIDRFQKIQKRDLLFLSSVESLRYVNLILQFVPMFHRFCRSNDSSFGVSFGFF